MCPVTFYSKSFTRDLFRICSLNMVIINLSTSDTFYVKIYILNYIINVKLKNYQPRQQQFVVSSLRLIDASSSYTRGSTLYFPVMCELFLFFCCFVPPSGTFLVSSLPSVCLEIFFGRIEEKRMVRESRPILLFDTLWS